MRARSIGNGVCASAAAALLALGAAAGCTAGGRGGGGGAGVGQQDDADGGGLPPGHPAIAVADPAANSDHVGRVPQRVDVNQLSAALLAATGHGYVGEATVRDPRMPRGSGDAPAADLLALNAGTLGRADYFVSVRESHDPTVPFTKIAGDAARSACAAGVRDDATLPPDQRRILREAQPTDTLASNGDAVRRNLSYLTLRFWARRVAADAPEMAPLVRLFERTSTAPAGMDRNGTRRDAATPLDGWRAVCIALATDPQFLTY